MANPSVTYSFNNGTTADATQVNQNFIDLISAMTDGSKSFSIDALTCAGTATLNGNVILGNAAADTLTVNGTLSGGVFTNGVTINESGADSDTRIEGDTDANLFVCDASADKIGIGTASPTGKLNILQDAATNTTPALRITGSLGDPTNYYLDIVPILATGVDYRFDLKSASMNTAMLMLKANGRVGLGIAAPLAKLHAVGDTLLWDSSNSGATDYCFQLRTQVGGTDVTKWRVEADGDTISATGSYTSDERVKTNLDPIKYGLSEILALKPKSFNWIHEKEGDTKSFCLSTAQEVEKIMPEMVRDDGQEFCIDGKNQKVKSVYDKEIMAVMVKAIQEQQAQIEQLKSEVMELRQ
jgi:hypothetical protein